MLTTHLPRQNIHIPLVRAEYSGSCLKFCTETAERRIAGDVIPHRAVQMTLNDYEEYDYLIGIREYSNIIGRRSDAAVDV